MLRKDNPDKMSGSRIERKRAVDRKAQQAVRERTKNRIAQLEQEVEYYKRLSQEDGSGVLQEVYQLREDNARLRRQLNAIKSILSPDEDQPGKSLKLDSNAQGLLPVLSDDVDIDVVWTIGVCTKNQDSISVTPHVSVESTVDWPRCSSEVSLDYPSLSLEWNFDDLFNLQKATDIYARVYRMTPDHISQMKQADLSSVVKAINEGWDALNGMSESNPLLNILRDIDQQVFAQADSTLRLAVMYKNYHLVKVRPRTYTVVECLLTRLSVSHFPRRRKSKPGPTLVTTAVSCH